jgi:site-specific DNA recombinase
VRTAPDAGDALEEQRRQVDELAQEQGFPVQRWFVDQGVDGSTPLGQRPAWAELVTEVQAGTYQVVVVLRLDRLGRTRKMVDQAVQAVSDAGGHVRALTV